MRRAAALAVAVAALLPVAARADAQDQGAAPRFPQGRELAVGVVWSAPVGLDKLSADLTTGSGGTLPLFRADSDLAAAVGLEVGFLERVTRRLDIEIAGAWARVDVRTRITDDFEDVSDIELTNALSRFTVEGGALWRVADRAQTTWFARGSAGWLRELDGDSALAENGYVVNVGGGVKYWTRPASGTGARAGLRVEGRLMLRRTGPSLGDELQIGPVLVASAVFGF